MSQGKTVFLVVMLRPHYLKSH